MITLKNLTIGYDDHIVAKNINAKMSPGDFVCVVGPNGSGKSTLIKTILHLMKPKSGKVIYEDGLKQNFIGYMPQEISLNPNFPASVFEIVLSGTLNRKQIFYNKEAKKLADRNLEILKIKNLKTKSFCDLSGGQRQKVLLARSLCATSKLLILDEPSNNLDLKSKTALYQILKDINKKQGITIIMVTHDLDHHNLIGNKILSLNNDFFYGPTSDFVKKVHQEEK